MTIETLVLLADDHDLIRAGIRNALEDLSGIRVIGEVGDGPALEMALAQLEPDLLLLDVTMPDFDPIRTIHEIRHTYPDLKILVVSAFDDDIYVQGLLSAGVNGYHLKDQPLSDLKLAVQRVMLGKRWVTGRLLDKLVQPLAKQEHALPSLTQRQLEILSLLQEGYDNQRIATEIGISVKTVENHLTRLYRQLNVQSRLEAVNYVRTHPGLKPSEGRRESQRPLPPPPSSAEGPRTVLLVDDNGRFRTQMRRMIQRIAADISVYEAENTERASALAEAIQPRLAIVDVVLGNEDGIQCIKTIRPHIPDSRIILISAYPDREFHRRGLAAGATAFLDKKDLDSAALQQIVEDALS